QRVANRARSLGAHLVVGEQDAKDSDVVSGGFDVFGVAGQNLPRPCVVGGSALDADLLEEIDRLRPAVLDDLELVFRQVGDWSALAVADDHVNANDVDAAAEGG